MTGILTGIARHNAALREALDRTDAMRADPRWQEARELPKDHPDRKRLFNEARAVGGFDKGALASFGSRLRVGWLREGVWLREASGSARASPQWCPAKPRMLARTRGSSRKPVRAGRS